MSFLVAASVVHLHESLEFILKASQHVAMWLINLGPEAKYGPQQTSSY